MNIVSMVMQYLGPVIVGKIASSLGINQSLAQKAIAAALPVILGGLVGKAAQPGGGQILSDILGKQDTGILGNLGGLIGGAGQADVAAQGMKSLGSILGDGALGSLTGVLGKFAGIGEAPTKGLLGLLAPVALGGIAQQQKAAGLDAAGLASMLIGQKDNIQAAMPADFAKMLGGTGILDQLGGIGALGAGVAAATGAAAKAATSAAGSAASHATAAGTQAAKSSFNWLPWIALIAAAIAAWWFLFAAPKPAKVTLPAAPKVMVGNIDVGSQLGGVMGALSTSLGGIKDVSGANAALPALKAAQGDVDRIAALSGALPADSKKAIAGYLVTALPVLLPIINNLLANSSLAPILKPVIEPLIVKLTQMSKA